MTTFFNLRDSPLIRWSTTRNGATFLLLLGMVWCSCFPQTFAVAFWVLCLAGELIALCLIPSGPPGIILLAWKAWQLFHVLA